MNPEIWLDLAAQAWNAGEEGEHQKSLNLYAEAEKYVHGSMRFSPTLNLLRHAKADDSYFKKVNGFVIDVDPTEDIVLGMQTTVWKDQEETARGMKKTKINQKTLVKNIREYSYDAGYHLDNIRSLQPHILVMSTGRCGTIGLYRLLNQTQYQAHHAFYFNVSHVDRLELMCRFMDGQYGSGQLEPFYLKTRAAEWIGCCQAGIPMAICNHHDTIFAPTFALLHPKAKIIYLRRNPKDVFLSMYGKQQWGKHQIRPIFYKFKDNEWLWRDQSLDIPEQISWYLKFTESFSRALGEILSDRWIEIDADKLFKKDIDELTKLKEFAELEISLDEMVDHYGTVFNRKAHKLSLSVKESTKIFEEVYGAL